MPHVCRWRLRPGVGVGPLLLGMPLFRCLALLKVSASLKLPARPLHPFFPGPFRALFDLFSEKVTPLTFLCVLKNVGAGKSRGNGG